MIKIKDLENYFEKSFDELLNDNDIIVVADDINGAWEDYYNWEIENSNLYEINNTLNGETKKYLNTIKDEFYKWVENCNADELLNYELNTYQRHFMLENGKVYYLNSYL